MEEKLTEFEVAQGMTHAAGEIYHAEGIPGLLRQAGAESCVLLKNNGVLPLDPSEEVAVFGRSQLDWFYVGYGSGGDVNPPYRVNLMDGLAGAGIKVNEELASAYRTWTSAPENRIGRYEWGCWPYSYPEMPLDPGTAAKAARTSRTALVVIARAAGEDRENTLTKGSYYLTDDERTILNAVTASFAKVVVLMNIGSIMDMSWTLDYGDRIGAILIPWQGGMESGNAVADVLTGKVSPSGILPDTIACSYEDYPSSDNFGNLEYNNYAEGIYVGYRYFDKHPEKVLYPFGYGLSYTDFAVKGLGVVRSAPAAGSLAAVKVTNVGSMPGKKTVQLFASAPEGELDKPLRVLVGFAKTDVLEPGQAQTLEIAFSDRDLSSYDEKIHAFIMDAGEYVFTADDVTVGSVQVPERIITEQCEDICEGSAALRERILERLPEEIVPSENAAPCTLKEVADGTASLDDFIAQLTDEELDALSRGHGMMNSVLGTEGNAGAIAGILPSLREKGVIPVITSDGPAGIRMSRYCSLVPCGTALASSRNTELVQQVYAKIGEEMTHYQDDVLLGPGMNIHRDPLCGRNFEYFSEDPVLAGKMGAAMTRGIQSQGHGCCPKHFACNNQEVNRNQNDSRVSERALREIYLRNFEICIREAHPLTIMTSYNKINGVWSHYNYDLCTTVLRKQWGYTGMVMTDWWMRYAPSPEFPQIRDNAYRVRAQVDVLMPGDRERECKEYRSDGTLLETLGQPGGITKGELQRTARNVLTLVLRVHYGMKG